MAKSVTQFLDEYKFKYKFDDNFEILSLERRKFIANKLINECTDENGILDLCDSKIFFNGCTFWGCKNLQKVILPENLQKIGEYYFYHCMNLQEIIIPNSVKKIGNFAFCECKNLQKVTLSENLQEISHSAFRDCKNLREIIIPDSLDKFGNLDEWNIM